MPNVLLTHLNNPVPILLFVLRLLDEIHRHLNDECLPSTTEEYFVGTRWTSVRGCKYGPELKNGGGGCHEGLGYVCTLSQIDNAIYSSLISAPVRADGRGQGFSA